MTITKTIDTDSVKRKIDLREYADAYTTLDRVSVREKSGPCPKCGGTKRFHCRADWFFCRDCHEKRGDVIEFVMWMNGCDFKTAVSILTDTPLPAPTTKRTPDAKRNKVEFDASKATTLATTAHNRLLDDNDHQADAGRAYLDSRGIESHTWLAFKLGYSHNVAIPGTEGKERAPAIVMPWYRRGKICAIRYRFLAHHGNHKQTALYGSSFAGTLYGGQTIGENSPELSTLVICEGESNACSIWQVSRYTHLDVLSLGSESASITPSMINVASRYASVICWLDREERAKAVMAILTNAYGIKSSDGQDANDLLQSGMLGGFMAMHRFQAAKDRTAQKRVLGDLMDASCVWQGVDEGTSEVIRHIAEVLS